MKRNKKTACLETLIVAGDVQNAFPTGSIVGSGTTMNITNGYISAVSKDPASLVRAYDNHIQNTDTYPGVRQIAIVQGTPASADTTTYGRFGFGNPIYVKSDNIEGSRIRKISTTYPNYGSQDALAVTSIATPVDNATYGLQVINRGSRQHYEYGQVLDDAQYASFTTPDYTALAYTAAQAESHMLHNVLTNLATFSKKWSTNVHTGNKNFIVFGINLAGGGGITGQALGTIANGSAFTWAVNGGVNLTFTADPAFVQTMSAVIANTALTASSEIVPLNVAAPITSTNLIDCFLVVGLDETQPVAFTDIPTKRNRILLTFKEQFRVVLPVLEEGSNVREPLNTGWLLWLRWRANAAIRNSQQNQPHGDFYPEVPYYFSNSQSALYTVTEIQFYADSENLNSTNIQEERTLMLFPATATNITDTANTLAGADFTYATTNSTLIADTETILGDWLQSAQTYSQFELSGLCTATTYFF
jgi:hypothetical protein